MAWQVASVGSGTSQSVKGCVSLVKNSFTRIPDKRLWKDLVVARLRATK